MLSRLRRWFSSRLLDCFMLQTNSTTNSRVMRLKVAEIIAEVSIWGGRLVLVDRNARLLRLRVP